MDDADLNIANTGLEIQDIRDSEEEEDEADILPIYFKPNRNLVYHEF